MVRRRPLTCVLLLAAIAIASRDGKAASGPNDGWIEVQTEHFKLTSNAGRSSTIKIGTRLEQLWQVLAASFADVATRPPTRIYVFRDEAAFAPFKIGANGKPDSIAGYYVATPLANYIAIDASAGEAPFRTVYHEFVHYFIHNNLPYVPLWLNEGLAEYYSTFKIKGNGAEIGLPIEEHRYWLAQYDLIPLEQLFLIDTSSPEYREGLRRGTFYAQSWALTHYVMSRPDKKQVNVLLRELREGATPGDAFKAAYDLDLGALEKELEAAYTTGRGLGYQEWKFAGDWESGSTVARPLGRGEVAFQLGDLLTHNAPLQFAAAESYLLAALAADSARAGTYASLGQLYHEAERYPESHTHYARAVSMAPDEPAIRLGYGLSLLEEYFAPEGGQPLVARETPALLLAAREQLQRAVTLQMPGLEDELGFGRTFLLDRGAVFPGISALTLVVNQEPWRLDAVRDLVALTAHSGNQPAARALLEKSLRPRGSPELVRQAELVIADEDLRLSPPPTSH
jgi:tetratricopeptide (TPR) repeat protein